MTVRYNSIFSTIKKTCFTTQLALFLLLSAMLCGGCQKEETGEGEKALTTDNKPRPASAERFVLMTYDKTIIPSGPMAGREMMNSYVSCFPEMPSGDNVSNIVPHNTMKGHIGKNGGGLLQSGNRLYLRSNSATNAFGYVLNSPVKLEVPPEGRIREVVFKHIDYEGFIYTSKNFAITDKAGYLCMPSTSSQRGNLYVHFFDPVLMHITSPQIFIIRRTDIEKMVKEVVKMTPEMAGLQFPYTTMGLNFCEMHNGKLLMDIVFYKEGGSNISPDIYIVAVNPEPAGAWEAISAIKNSGLVGRTSESSQHCHDEKGDLYILSRGGDPVGFYRNSVISRVKKDRITVDPEWELRISNFVSGRAARFNGIYAAKNKIITLVNNAPLASTTKDMDLENVWDYYVIDMVSKEAKKIEGLKSCSGFISGANLVSEIDGKYYLRYVRTGDDAPWNGYYEYDFSTNRATPAFNISKGGYAVDLKKIKVE